MALCSLILFAGHETTTNLLCNAIVALDRHPPELARLGPIRPWSTGRSRKCCGSRARSRS